MMIDKRFSHKWFVLAVHLGRKYRWACERKGSRRIIATPLGMCWFMRKKVST